MVGQISYPGAIGVHYPDVVTLLARAYKSYLCPIEREEGLTAIGEVGFIGTVTVHQGDDERHK